MVIISKKKDKRKKHKGKVRHYNSKTIHAKNVEKTLQDIKNIEPKDEPTENREVISDFYREQKLDKKWDKRRKLKK